MLKKRLTALVCAGAMMMGTAGTFAMNASADSFEDYKFDYFEYPFGECTNYNQIADYQNNHYVNDEIPAFLDAMAEKYPMDEEIGKFILKTEQDMWKRQAECDIVEYGEVSYYNTEEFKATYPVGVYKSGMGLIEGEDYYYYYILENTMGCDKVFEICKVDASDYSYRVKSSAELSSYADDLILSTQDTLDYYRMTNGKQLEYSINFFNEHGDFPVVDLSCYQLYWDYRHSIEHEYYMNYGTEHNGGYYLQAGFLENVIDYDALDKTFVENYDNITNGKFKASIPFKVLTKDENVVVGDANCDGNVTIADAVAIQQYLANAVKYPLSAQGLINADFDGDGITGADALEIQKMDAAQTVS